jgi:hypothetical protein
MDRFWHWVNRLGAIACIIGLIAIVYSLWAFVFVLLAWFTVGSLFATLWFIFGTSGLLWQKTYYNPTNIIDAAWFIVTCVIFPQVLLYGVGYCLASYASSIEEHRPSFVFWVVLGFAWLAETQVVCIIIWLLKVYWETQIRVALLWNRPGMPADTNMDDVRRDFILHGPITGRLRRFPYLWLCSARDYELVHQPI